MSISSVLHGKGHQVVKVRTTDSVESAVRTLSGQHIGAVVVEDQWMHNAGIFSERDFLHAVAEKGAAALTMPVQDFMSAPLVTCGPADRVENAMAAMTAARIRHLPVAENGQLIGIVSIGDLVKYRLDQKDLEASVLLDIDRLHA